jgi:hypothetical protein
MHIPLLWTQAAGVSIQVRLAISLARAALHETQEGLVTPIYGGDPNIHDLCRNLGEV